MNYIPNYKDIHPGFKLNGFTLTLDDLNRISYTYVKEGEPYERAAGSFLLDWLDSKSYVEVQTSGTTGESKVIQIEKQAMIHSALATAEYFDLPAGTKALHCLSSQYIAGKMMFVRAMILGWDMDFVEPTSEILKRNPSEYDFAALVPLQVMNSLERLHLIKKIIIGGAKLNDATEKRLEEIPSDIYETYGMTETVTHIAAKKVGEKVFTILPNVAISQDENGCLIIRAPKVNPEEIRTKDVVELMATNQFRFLGRADNLINSGGVKLIPEQLESRLSSKMSRRFFIGGIEDPALGQKAVLFIEGEKFDIPSDLFDGFDKFEIPKDIRFIDKFPETGSGKILRRELLG